LTENRDAAAVRIFPPAIPVATIAAGVLLQRFWPLDRFAPAPERYWVGGAIIVAAILGLGLWAVITMRRTGQSENPWKPTTEIVAAGPFRFTRNPMYLQMVIVTLGAAVLLGNVWVLLLTPVGAWLLQRFAIRPEEDYLEAKFGEAYVEYKRRVRRWI
jgi:protein-S-isoprenylcysteine O-methyltransferase Ste14